MTLFASEALLREYARLEYEAGESLVKSAGDAVKSYSLSGRLYLAKSGWLLLSVPNNLIRGTFDALHEAGAEYPPPFKGSAAYQAHITVMRPEEVEQAGGADAITERGHQFHYTTGPLREVEPANWDGVSKVWYIEIGSPELEKLRKSYGLSAKPKNNEHDFHITVAIRKKNILTTKPVSKAASDNAHDYCPTCGKKFVMSCRCRNAGHRCEDGHEWHRCRVHKVTALGMGHGTGDETGCTCNSEKTSAATLPLPPLLLRAAGKEAAEFLLGNTADKPVEGAEEVPSPTLPTPAVPAPIEEQAEPAAEPVDVSPNKMASSLGAPHLHQLMAMSLMDDAMMVYLARRRAAMKSKQVPSQPSLPESISTKIAAQSTTPAAPATVLDPKLAPDFSKSKPYDLNYEDRIVKQFNRLNHPLTAASAVIAPAAIGGLLGSMTGDRRDSRRGTIIGAGVGAGGYAADTLARMAQVERLRYRLPFAAAGSVIGGLTGYRLATSGEKRSAFRPAMRNAYRQLPTINPKDYVLGGLAGGTVGAVYNRASSDKNRDNNLLRHVVGGALAGGAGTNLLLDRARKYVVNNIHPFGYGTSQLPAPRLKDVWYGGVLNRPTPSTLLELIERYKFDKVNTGRMHRLQATGRFDPTRVYQDPLRAATRMGLVTGMGTFHGPTEVEYLKSRRELMSRFMGQHVDNPAKDFFVRHGGNIIHNPAKVDQKRYRESFLTPRPLSMSVYSAGKAHPYAPMSVDSSTSPLNQVWGSHGFELQPGSTIVDKTQGGVELRKLQDTWDFKIDSNEKDELKGYLRNAWAGGFRKLPSLLQSPASYAWDPDSRKATVSGRVFGLAKRQVLEGVLGKEVPVLNQKVKVHYPKQVDQMFGKQVSVEPIHPSKEHLSPQGPISQGVL